jgi:fused signal recognition particle receptor
MSVSDAGGEGKQGWFQRLKSGLSRSSSNLQSNIASVFTGKKPVDAATLEELEEALISADMGVETAMALTEGLKQERFGKEASEDEIRQTLAGQIAALLEPVAKPLTIDAARKPEVILVCGVNGTGKTTTIGKLSQQFVNDGRKVMLAAGDTFRAAAIEQLEVWGRRTDCPVIAKAPGADAAGLAFEALEKAKAEGADVLLIDTAGRLHNKSALMDELAKIVRVLKKQDVEAPHQTLLVLDATTGQNAKAQVETFQSMVPLSGLVVTKLDGTARGGVVVGLARQFGLPVHAIGVGEGVYDLRAFEAKAFANALLGLENSVN